MAKASHATFGHTLRLMGHWRDKWKRDHDCIVMRCQLPRTLAGHPPQGLSLRWPGKRKLPQILVVVPESSWRESCQSSAGRFLRLREQVGEPKIPVAVSLLEK